MYRQTPQYGPHTAALMFFSAQLHMWLIMFTCVCVCELLPRSLTSSHPFCRECQGIMQPSGHRLRDIEHHPLLTDNDNYDSASSSSSEADMADRVWFIRDGCGMVCAVMTWLLVVYADFVVTFVMLLPSKDFWYSVVNGVIFNCLAVLALSSHLRTMLTDPVSPQHLCLEHGLTLSRSSTQHWHR